MACDASLGFQWDDECGDESRMVTSVQSVVCRVMGKHHRLSQSLPLNSVCIPKYYQENTGFPEEEKTITILILTLNHSLIVTPSGCTRTFQMILLSASLQGFLWPFSKLWHYFYVYQ